MTARAESELASLRRLAEELAAGRKERVTSAHLLAAIATREGPTASLLLERGLSADRLLRAARASSDDVADPLQRALGLARGVALRAGVAEQGASAAHLLVALLSERTYAAFRALAQQGTDVSRLRTEAMQLGLGRPGARSAPRQSAADAARGAAPSAVGRRAPTGVTIPLFPPPKPAPAPSPAPDASSAVAIAEPVSAAAPPRGAPSASQPPPAPVRPSDVALTEPIPRAPQRSAATPARRRGRGASLASGRFELDAQRFPTLVALGQNLTLAAARGELDPAVGRQREIEAALDVLAKRQGNSPCLVGAAGVGKTSVVRGLARRIAEGREVGGLDERVVVEIPTGELVAGTGVRGALAARVGALRKEVAAAEGRVVVFFDEIHQLFSGDGVEELTGELKLALSRGELPCIGATTPEDFRKAIEQDAALARRFTVVEVEEPSREDAFLVLSSLAERLAAHHRVRYDDEALALAVAWSVRYLPGRALPDKAVGLADLAGARARRRGLGRVTPEALAEVVADVAHVPLARLLETDAERMLRLEGILAERVVGHKAEIARIARILRRNAAGLGARRPIGTFLFLGPTGVGKTETAKAIAEVMFGEEAAMTRIDLSEYGEPHAVARLLGAPPGYVGHEAGGQLTEAVRRRPYQVVLLDEVEKAHPDVLLAFLAVFDEGRMTDGRGRTVDFTSTIVLMTSNVGASESGASPRRRVGFGNDGPPRADVERAVIACARQALAPELYNRIDEVLVFAPLGRDDVREVARRMIQGLSRQLERERSVTLRTAPAAVEHLLEAGGYDPTLGARPMRRTIARLVEAPLAELVLSGKLVGGDRVTLDADAAGLVFGVEGAARAGAAE